MSEQAYCEICGTFPADDGGGQGARLRCEIERAHEEIIRLRDVVRERNKTISGQASLIRKQAPGMGDDEIIVRTANGSSQLIQEGIERQRQLDAARAECEKLRKALDESLLFLDSAAQASPLIPSTLVRIVESVRGTLRNALAKETP